MMRHGGQRLNQANPAIQVSEYYAHGSSNYSQRVVAGGLGAMCIFGLMGFMAGFIASDNHGGERAIIGLASGVVFGLCFTICASCCFQAGEVDSGAPLRSSRQNQGLRYGTFNDEVQAAGGAVIDDRNNNRGSAGRGGNRAEDGFSFYREAIEAAHSPAATVPAGRRRDILIPSRAANRHRDCDSV